MSEIDVDCLDKSHGLRLHVNMYNLGDSVCWIRQMKREFWASFHQPTKFPTHVDRQT